MRRLLLIVAIVLYGGMAEGTQDRLVGPAPPTLEQRPPFSLSPGTDSTLLREPPAIAGQYQIGRQALVPFVGLGFSRGATTDVSGTMMRSTAQQGSLQEDRLLRDVGQTMLPNEVQLGIRLPF